MWFVTFFLSLLVLGLWGAVIEMHVRLQRLQLQVQELEASGEVEGVTTQHLTLVLTPLQSELQHLSEGLRKLQRLVLDPPPSPPPTTAPLPPPYTSRLRSMWIMARDPNVIEVLRRVQRGELDLVSRYFSNKFTERKSQETWQKVRKSSREPNI